MACQFSWHPSGDAFNARAQQRNGTIWVSLDQGAGDARQSAVFYFSNMSHAEAIAVAFNSGPQPAVMDETDSFTFKPVDNGVPDGPEN